MQRMIRQFAAEYTSKNSSTQDCSPPNSTKNQSLPKSPSGQSSPPPATTQNPVLSKLLMADQDSPLDLTVKKPHLEEPCEQADGVLDLSTKKSPCSGSPNSSISPSTSNNIGNGTRDTEKNAIDPNNSSLSLEMFMAKLCSHHQKQFILVLNNLCTEESIMKSKSRSASVSKIESHDNIDDYDHSYSDRKADLSLVAMNKSYSESCLNCQVPINTPTNPHEDNYHSGKSHCSGYLSKAPISSDYKQDHANNISHAADQSITYNPLGIPTTDEKRGTTFAKIADINQAVFLGHYILSNSNSALNMLNDSPGSELPTNIPEIANKENTQDMAPKQTHLDCSDCKLKQENSTTSGTAKKLGNHYETPIQDLADHSASSFQNLKLHENKHLSVKCKNSRTLMTNDCDKQCDVVYISEPVTTECHFENHKSVACPRNTARKSTRGYLFNSNCCELSTVRTLVRSSKVEDRGNASLHTSEALIIPNGLIETLPSTDILSLIQVEEKRVEIETFEPTPQNDEMTEITPDFSRNNENCDESLKMAKEPVEDVSGSLIAVFSLQQKESEKTHVLSNLNEMPLNGHDVIPKMKLNSVVNTDANFLYTNLEKSVANLATDPDIDVSHSINSCNQEDISGTPALDMEVIVSLKNNHVLSESTPPVCSPHNTLMEDASTLQYSHASLSTAYSSSFPSRAADKKISNVRFSSVNDAKILPGDSSQGVITEPVFSSDPQLIVVSSDHIPKENFESQISKTFQDNLSSSDMIKLNDHTTQGVAKETVDSDVKNSENAKDDQSVDLNDSVKMKIEIAPDNTATVRPLLDELHCPTPASLNVSEHFHSPLNRCAKIVGNITVKLEENGSKEDLNHCCPVSSSDCNKNDTIKKPVKMEVVNGESKLDDEVSLDDTNYSLGCNKNTIRHLTPTKRNKKAPAPTDRCLRSHEAPGEPPPTKISSLQVLISYANETNSAQRSVALIAEDAPHAVIVHSLIEETITDENYFAMSINSHCREGQPLLYERLLKHCLSPFKMLENLKICFKIGSNKRMVYFARENNHNCLKTGKTECKYSAKSLGNTCQLQLKKCKKEMLENSNYISQSRSNNKPVKVKDRMMSCKLGKLKNLSTENKQTNNCNTQISRPKFLDWCSEEENQERISSFNDKYTTVHNNWIPLDREMANMVKYKNKSDKLKEIWKTKKRVRRPKSVQDAQKCSPMQMLFTNSFKLSDICGWFMETTETKSLVIVKQLNTRLPEEHQLPMIPSPKYSTQSLYPHILQAQRLKKHLKKFASVSPARNDPKTEDALNNLIDSSVPLDQVSKDTVKGPDDCQKQELHDEAKNTAPVHLQKYNRLRENLESKSCTVNKNNLFLLNKKKLGNVESRKEISTSESNLPKVPNSKKLKNKKNRKRSKNYSVIESVPHLTKKIKMEAKQGLFKNSLQVNKNISPKTKVSKLSKIDITSKSQAPKKQVGKAGGFKTSLRKGRAKTPMQKQSLKSQLVQKRKTRSAKLRQVSPNFSDSTKITSLSSSHRKKELRKICTVSAKNKIIVAPQVRQRKQRSRLEPSTRKRRSLEMKN